jgi:transketolase
MTTLRHVPLSELERIRSLDADPWQRASAFADACRINVLTMVMRAGSGHIGTSFSVLDVLSWLHLEVLGPRDRVFSSKGHDAPAVYAVLAGVGQIPFDKLFTLRRLGGLPGHPDVLETPEVITNTGSLGMGVSKARGFVLADTLAGRPRGRVFVITGDGELQEGQFWESLQPTANRDLDAITVIVDCNKLQSDTWVDRVSDLGDIVAKAAAFGWASARCDGNDVRALAAALERLDANAGGRPRLLVADTSKGAGVSFMEPDDLARADSSLYGFHSGAPSEDEYARALDELVARLDARLVEMGASSVQLVELDGPVLVTPETLQRLIPAYGDALVQIAERHGQLVALDADLRLDCGLVEFQRRFPERFFECGIAEQDMVSQAGAMALSGLLPVVHSFACFLSTRPNEQVFNNTTEGTKVIYVGSLAGLVPGGPGHSHQSVRDIALFGSNPGMAALEPYCELEVVRALNWAVDEADGPVYIRLVSVPWELGFEPSVADFVSGRGTVLREGSDATFVTTGPVLVSQAWRACELLAAEGVSAGLVALPWLRDVDGAWLAEAVPDGLLVTLDNHYLAGGQGDAVLAALSESAPAHAARVRRLGVDRVPVCGTNDEVLRAHALDAESVARRVASLVVVAV